MLRHLLWLVRDDREAACLLCMALLRWLGEAEMGDDDAAIFSNMQTLSKILTVEQVDAVYLTFDGDYWRTLLEDALPLARERVTRGVPAAQYLPT